MPEPKPTNQRTAIARASLAGMSWKSALRNTKQAWLADNPGARLPVGRKSKSKLIWEQCDVIKKESRQRLTLGQLIKRVKEKIDCSDDTIMRHVKTWMARRLTINEIPKYYLKQPPMQDYGRKMRNFEQAYRASEAQFATWAKSLPPETVWKDITASQWKELKKPPSRLPQKPR